ncbi:uncharacterized protein J4E88_006445 [Alternaria novae-zelandiae]|uniref:uncharacterized protein n=1 Tax=Alternaria novae-zelandiae TaxID=430562 RepID=UPI0020C3BCA6|nr:uncharacterized protein J4E88_006445 [Alternaria novae-zelandiae]KAI4679152.1 hypothetical protein J4E88_006445 [Alternaria novae-zelandiae]
MEGVAAFSLACNVIQIAELSRKIIATAKEIQTSRSGLPKDHEDLRTAVEILRRDVADLQQNHNGDIIQSLAVQSEVAINEHIALLDSLRLKGPRTFLHASAAAFKARRKQRQLYESQAKVDRLSEELKAHIIMTHIPNIDRNVDHLGDKIASHNFSIDHDMKIIEQHLSRVRKVTENNSNTANTTAELVVELQRWLKDQQDSQANRQCLHALYSSELRSRADQVKRAHKDTFSWIFDGAGDLFGSVHKNKFKNWLRLDDANRNVFWVYGKPGAGKSTLIKDVLWNGCQNLFNLAPSFNIFMLFIIDGLDEFDDRAEIRKNSAPDVQDLLRLLRAMQASPSAKLCVASRPLNEFEIHLGKDRDFCIPIHDLTSEDIKTYTEDTLSEHPAFAQLVSQDSGYATLIANITSAAEGVFLWCFASDAFHGSQHEIEMSKLSHERVRLAHRSMAELLDRNDMRHQIMTEAGMAFEMPELCAQASIAALKAEASIAWTLGSIQDIGIHFGKQGPMDVKHKLCTLLQYLVPIVEQTEEEQMKAHWSKLDDFLNLPLTQEMNLKAIIMGFVSKEFNPDIFAVAIAYSASKYVKHQMV